MIDTDRRCLERLNRELSATRNCLKEVVLANSALSINEVSQRLKVSESTTRRLIKASKIRASRVGQQWRIFELDLRDYITQSSNQRTRSER